LATPWRKNRATKAHSRATKGGCEQKPAPVAQNQATTLQKHAPVVQKAQAQRQGLPQRAKPTGCNGVRRLFA
ncbi:MAG: hypothetical protein IJD18_02340, partial [Clostridia bacterium]|nr:hypothetical protein [Clostridia bacterium]